MSAYQGRGDTHVQIYFKWNFIDSKYHYGISENRNAYFATNSKGPLDELKTFLCASHYHALHGASSAFLQGALMVVKPEKKEG